jgi:hypothetical protein
MTPEEIRTKASELAALYVAKANGRVLQYLVESLGWINEPDTQGPDMQSDLSRWRVNPLCANYAEVLP